MKKEVKRFKLNPDDAKLVIYHRAIRMEYIQKIADELRKEAFIIDGKQGEMYNDVLVCMASSSAAMTAVSGVCEMKEVINLNIATSVIFVFLGKFLAFFNDSLFGINDSNDSQVTLRKLGFLEKLSELILTNKDSIYDEIESSQDGSEI